MANEEIQDNGMETIPLTPEEYQLGDVVLPDSFAYLPDSFKNITFDKQGFANIVHKYGLTKAQASGLWNEYTKLSLEAGEKGYYEAQANLEEARIQEEIKKQEELERQENEETEETVETKGDYHLTKEEAQAWRDRIRTNPNHAYWNEKATIRERDLAVAFVQRLDKIIAEGGGSIEGYITVLDGEQRKQMKALYGPGILENKHGSNEVLPNATDRQPDTNLDNIGYGEQEKKSGSGDRIEDYK